jgi:hypothetical protein
LKANPTLAALTKKPGQFKRCNLQADAGTGLHFAKFLKLKIKRAIASQFYGAAKSLPFLK